MQPDWQALQLRESQSSVTQEKRLRPGILGALYNKTHRREFGSSSVCLHLILPSASALSLPVLCLLADLCLALLHHLPHLFLSHLFQGRTDFKVEESRKGKDYDSYCLPEVLTFFIFPLISLSHFRSLTSTQPPKCGFKQAPPCCLPSPQGKDMPEHIPSFLSQSLLTASLLQLHCSMLLC